MKPALSLLASFVFYYPLVMAIIWTVGGLMFYLRRERSRPQKRAVGAEQTPMVSILIPAYNESDTIAETVRHLESVIYPHYEVIVINDGSHDGTAQILRQQLPECPHLRVINLRENRGKAHALLIGLAASHGEILLTLDAGALLDPEALNQIVPHFVTPGSGERVGAVTGNPRVRNRSSLLGRIQVVEYSSIIGLIKRSQRILGKVMTVSGVVVAFRKRALLDCGLWDKPRALCWMLVPETLQGLWKQRLRWSQGGLEVLLRHWSIFADWRQRRLWPVYISEAASLLWSFAWVVATVLMLLGIRLDDRLVPGLWPGIYLVLVALIQFAASYPIERNYEQRMGRWYLWAVWYPILFWYFNLVVVLAAFPRALQSKKQFATWESPDRGLKAG